MSDSARAVGVLIGGIALGWLAQGCGVPVPPSPPPSNAEYIGSAACRSCHPSIGALQSIQGHSQALKMISDGPPVYPTTAPAAGVPNPPLGFTWSQIAYVIGGYTKAANFVDDSGFLLTDGTAGTHAQWNLLNGPADLPAGFVAFVPGQTTPLSYAYSCFICHTTGPESVDTNGGQRQGNRPGIGGTWAEDAVQCEACHGPGSLHVPDPAAGNIILDSTSATCARCHVNQNNPTSTAIAAQDGFIVGTQQLLELSASPMASFSCVVCHNPHASALYDPANGIRNQCIVCHPGQNMALHSGKVLAIGDYVELLACESCHMPLASKNASSTLVDVLGDTGRVGDTRTHIFNINVVVGESMLTPDGSQVAIDASGQAAVTLDYVCLRCHNGKGSAFALTLSAAGAIARNIHNPQ
jgi:hypothetical protein